MADEAERLVIAPFREIVEKGSAALQNAQDVEEDKAADMVKAAQSLLKEGERALKRIEPLCSKNYSEYGVNFIDAVKEHDELAQYRSELEDLLWDFDDYIEVDEFDAEKFDQLQKASRRAAPKVLDILKRMKLVTPHPRPYSMSSASRTQTPTNTAGIRTSSQGIPVDEDGQVLSPRMEAVAGPDEGLNGRPGTTVINDDLGRRDSHRSGLSEPISEPFPRPPSVDPWQFDKAPPTASGEPLEGDALQRRLLVGTDSPTLYPTALLSAVNPHNQSVEERRASAPKDDEDRRMRAASQSAGAGSEGSFSPPPQSARWTSSTYGSNESAPAPLQVNRRQKMSPDPGRSPTNGDEAISKSHNYSTSRSPSDASVFSFPPSFTRGEKLEKSHGRGSSLGNEQMFPTRQASLPTHKLNLQLHPPKRQPSAESVNSSVFDIIEYASSGSPVTNVNTNINMKRSSTMSAAPSSPYSPIVLQPPAYPSHPIPYRQPGRGDISPTGTIGNQSMLTLQGESGGEPVRFTPSILDGLIPVESEGSVHNMPLSLRQTDCSIGPNSSFYKLKGFCKGAEDAKRGGPGFKKIKRPAAAGNFTANSIGFRLRILQKSHLSVRHVEEQLYGCVFCIQQGKTNEESDATVFFTQKQLLLHLARHPRPLPAVPGLTVIEGSDMPPDLKDNFDLHFPNPPIRSVMTGIMPEISKLPTAVATETRKYQNGVMRTPPDRTPVLHFAVGAKIVGIEFPPKYEGKWGLGWHDGVRAAFETDTVLLDAPPKGEIRMQGTSNVQAVARWKWNQKGGDEKWLRFDKGDVIKNISWSHKDHWCWSGTSAKGWGVFPQSHLEPSSIQTVQPGDSGSVSSGEKKPTWLSIRRNADRKFPFISEDNPNPSTVPTFAAVRFFN
ncbi:hypothetical protein SLS62_008604 [Diatrype stigma]|uniref:SH3 domain-containing protein n=1 Tax=Diatrype stigma TaxID=117547 RepID=A0AAN9UTU4_9PEZI